MKKATQITHSFWAKFILVAVMAFMGSTMANAAGKLDLTDPTVIEEGLTKAETALNNMAKEIDALETQEDLMKLEQILNPIELRKVKKMYGKIQLTDEMRPRLVAANMVLANSLKEFIYRAGAPYEVQQMLSEQISEERVTEEIAKAKTLREVLE